MNDIFHRIYCWYVSWAGNISDDRSIMLVRLALLFAVPSIILYWTFVNRQRQGTARFVGCMLADGLVLALPLRVPYDMTARAWILAVAVTCLMFLPGMLPFLMVPEAGSQLRLRRKLYVTAALLVVVGLLWS